MQDEFFPTPERIATTMWEALGDRNCVLEPSAGHGALVDWVLKDVRERHYFRRVTIPNRIDVIEADLECQMVLRGKAYNLVGDDFLAFVPMRRYNGIIMNPPFSVGSRHCLQAWQILSPGGRVVCLLNAETVCNPYTQERKQLLRIIEDHGHVTDLGPCFRTADRKTDVDVVMVVLNKDGPDVEFGYFDGLTIEKNALHCEVKAAETQAIMEPDAIQDLVDQYNKAVDAYKEVLRAKNKVLFYAKPVAALAQVDIVGTDADDTAAFNAFIDRLSDAAWGQIFKQTDIGRFVTQGVQEDFEKFRAQSKRAAFTAENITQLLQTLGSNVGNIMEEALLRCFDTLTKYDKSNRVHWEGWVSNDFYKVNKRMIVPYMIDVWGCVNYTRATTMGDLDRVLCNMTGKDVEAITTIDRALRESLPSFGSGRKAGKVGKVESEFFTVRFFKKGTVHLLWKDLNLLDRFNVAAAKGKRWLPGGR